MIITTLNKHRLIQQRLFEIHKYLSDINEIIISNDARSSRELILTLSKFQDLSDMPSFLVDTAFPTSFSANVNRGVEQSSSEYIIITQDDVMIEGNFISSLRNTLIAYEEHDKHCVAGKLLDFDTGWNKFHGYVVPYIEGWFISCRRDVWDDIGGLDENIRPYDAEDIDFAIKAKQKCYILADFSTPYLQHIRGQTIALDESRRRITEKNIQYVKEKWSEEELKEIYNE